MNFFRIKNTVYAGIEYLKNEGILKLLYAILLKIQNPRGRFISYIQWTGIEIWALQNPLPVDTSKAKVKYVDYKTTDELRASYPELNNLDIVHVDYVGNAEDLSSVENQSQDFVILNHVFEHLINPLKALTEWHRVLRTWWIVFLAVPEKTRTFDRDRPRTTLQHLIDDYQHPSAERDYEHFKEFAGISHQDPTQKEAEAKRLYDTNYSIHYHVFIQEDVVELIKRGNQNNIFSFDIIDQKALSSNPADNEFILILKKI